MTVKTIPAVQARTHLGEIMKRAFKNGDRFIVEKAGIPMIAILNANEYTQLIQEHEELFRIPDRIKARLPDLPAEEAEKDVLKTIQAIRKRRA